MRLQQNKQYRWRCGAVWVSHNAIEWLECLSQQKRCYVNKPSITSGPTLYVCITSVAFQQNYQLSSSAICLWSFIPFRRAAPVGIMVGNLKLVGIAPVLLSLPAPSGSISVLAIAMLSCFRLWDTVGVPFRFSSLINSSTSTWWRIQ